jgi:hypothetical protein
MHTFEKRTGVRDAGDRKNVSLPIAGGARFAIVPSAVGLIFVTNVSHSPAQPSNRSTKDIGSDIKSA